MKNIDAMIEELPTLEEYKDLVERNVSKLERDTSEDFWLLRAQLENEGFKYVGKKPDDEQLYKKFLEAEKTSSEIHTKARQAYNFKNYVEETIFQYIIQCYEVILTPSFNEEENRIDYTSFFIRPKGVDQELLKKINSLEEKAQKNYDLYLTTFAEMKNIKNRYNKDKEEQAKYANASLIKTILPTVDNLYRTIEHSKKDSNLPSSFVQGIEMILNQMLSSLKKEGLEEVKALGEPFNPEFHEAVSMQPSEEIPKGDVLQELQKGYILNGRLIRPSAVIVSQGKG